MSGEQLEKIIADLIGAPPEVLARVRNALRPNDQDLKALAGAKPTKE